MSAILSGLIYARILSPASKRSSYDYLQTLIEKPKFELHDVYRSLDVLSKASESSQAMLYEHGASEHSTSVLYYDCMNFFFEIEDEDDFIKYGMSKEHRPNPIVQLGLFLDGKGTPLAFTVFPETRMNSPRLFLWNSES